VIYRNSVQSLVTSVVPSNDPNPNDPRHLVPLKPNELHLFAKHPFTLPIDNPFVLEAILEVVASIICKVN
jgi:hypothetical protein